MNIYYRRLPIDVRMHYVTAVAMFSIIGQDPVYFENMFIQNNSMHNHNTRSWTYIYVENYLVI